MPQFNKDVDNTDFLTRLAARDKFLTGTSGLTRGLIGYDITLNNRTTLSAEQNADGTWKSKAFSVSLPFEVNIKEQFAADVSDFTEYVMAYRPYKIDLDKKELIFTHVYPEITPGEAYVILVKKGSIALTGKNVTIVDVPADEFESDFEFDDDETGISTIIRNTGSNDRYYDLQGRQVIGKPSKGVYIINGKVVIVK